MRSNLDPFDEHTDEEIWNALNLVHLKADVQAQAGKLDSLVSESAFFEGARTMYARHADGLRAA